MLKKSLVVLSLVVIFAGSLTSCALFGRNTPTVESATTATSQSLPPTSTSMPAPATATEVATFTDTPAPPPSSPSSPLPSSPTPPSPSSTASAPTIRVTADILNAREEPNTDAEILTKLQQGTMLPVLGRSVAGDWVLIALSDGTEAWVSSEWVESSIPIDSLPVKETVPPTATSVPPTPTPSVTPTEQVTATATPLPSPVLLTPQHEQVFGARGPDQLTWEWNGILRSNQFFVVTISYPHEEAIWHDVHWVKETTFTPPEYLRDLITGDRRCEWTVVVMRQTSTASDGMKVGEPVSQTSEPRVFVWGN